MNFLSLSTSSVRLPKRFSRAPVTKLPNRVWRRYRGQLAEEVIDKWREAAIRIVVDKLPELSRQSERELSMWQSNRLDSWPDDVSRLIKLFDGETDAISNQAPEIASRAFKEVNFISRKLWFERIGRVMGINFSSYEPWIQNEHKAWVKENVALITKLQGDTVQDVERIVSSGLRTGQRVEAIRKEILGTDLTPGVFKKVETRAELIARDQTGKLLGDLNQRRQEELGITIYIWRTSKDERVRDSHEVLNEKYCSWKDPSVYADTIGDVKKENWKQRSSISAYIGDPGSDYQCRCYAEAVFETLFSEEK
jgi:SPP1 gp7 family putative phage head morphogenesis protein